MTVEPLVSVIVPAYHAERYLEAAVRSALDQTWKAAEVIVVDDGSSDATGDIADRLAAEEPRVRSLHQANAGPSAARNAGLAVADGAFIAFLDADDRFLPRKLERQIGALWSAPAADLVYSDHRALRDSDGAVFDVPRGPPPMPFSELLAIRNWFAPMAPLLRRSLVERVGPFDERLLAAEDWDYWYRCAQVGTFLYLPGAVGLYRWHDAQIHRDRARMIEAHRRFAEKHFADDPLRRRLCLASLHLQEAKVAYGVRDVGSCLRNLGSFLAQAGRPARARRVWRLLR